MAAMDIGRSRSFAPSGTHSCPCELTPSAAFYQREVFPAIKGGTPLQCDQSRDYELHILTCDRDVLYSLWSVKSFALAIGHTPPIAFHDDGTLSDSSAALLRQHFAGCRVLMDSDVHTDIEFHRALSAHPTVAYWRLEIDPPHARKAIDFSFFAEREFIVGLDSDVLFFRPPVQARTQIAERVAFMCEDYQSAYTPCMRELLEAGERIEEKRNSGFFGMRSESLALPIMEEFLKTHTSKPWFPWNDGWVEQTIIAAIYSRATPRRSLPRQNYSLSFDKITEETCCHHFVGDGSRSLFHSLGLRQLRRTAIATGFGVDWPMLGGTGGKHLNGAPTRQSN